MIIINPSEQSQFELPYQAILQAYIHLLMSSNALSGVLYHNWSYGSSASNLAYRRSYRDPIEIREAKHLTLARASRGKYSCLVPHYELLRSLDI
ncbi:hypothetical protein BJ508DRAFT_176182 [Ascobolus immersus RN42]|uniref:Uncharacterized protein n=1 Tax=Ascobolus immersus RN42 TaxID=1160509 RepID=A0A3N4IV05_ASCIM|nr:hypothetical protein BJ508DRAFT_176182 [Ascobolus immersus RN42]